MANYLYNGVELPALPEWHTTTYPYAVIYAAEAVDYVLLPARKKLECNADGELQNTSGDMVGTNAFHYTKDTKEWVAKGNGFLYANQILFAPIWSNYDVLDPSGNVYLAASEPIPAPAPEPLDPKSMLMGMRVGQIVASLRGKAAV